MAKNRIHELGRYLSLPVGDGVASGDPVIIGDLVGVALTDEGDGGNPDNTATVQLGGVWTLTVTGAVTDVGDAVYITSTGVVTATSTGNTLFGHALETKSAAAAEIPVRVVHQ